MPGRQQKQKDFPFINILSLIILGLFLGSCESAVVPVVGNYTGVSESISFRFEEIFDSDGNMIGIREIRDTVISQADGLSLSQVGKESKFTIEGSGGLSKLNSVSNHEFSYDGQSEFSLVSFTDGIETQRLEFNIDASGNLELNYIVNTSSNPNERPEGSELSFSGVKN